MLFDNSSENTEEEEVERFKKPEFRENWDVTYISSAQDKQSKFQHGFRRDTQPHPSLVRSLTVGSC